MKNDKTEQMMSTVDAEQSGKTVEKKAKDQAAAKTERETIRVTFEGDAAKYLFEIDMALKARNSRGELGRLLGSEILAIPRTRFDELIEEQTPADYYLALIQNHSDKDALRKILKTAARRLTSGPAVDVERPRRRTKSQIVETGVALESSAGVG